MRDLLTEWNRLAFGKRNSSINERLEQNGQDLIETLKEVDPQLQKYSWHITLENFRARNILVSMENPYAKYCEDPKVGLVQVGRDRDGVNITTVVPGTMEADLDTKNLQTGEPLGLTLDAYFKKHPDQGFLFLERLKAEIPQVYEALSARILKKIK